MFRKERAVVEDATETLRDSSQLLMFVAGAALIVSTIALVIAVSVKVSK